MATHERRESAAHSHAAAMSSSGLEFAETASVTLEWRLSGLKEMYDLSKGEVKSKCVRSAVFGDSDNLWEILFYPNSGSNNGDFSSLYLSCIPTQHEKDQAVGKRWVRQGLWWFKLEIRTLPDPSSGKSVTIATKDASDHTFAVKTANWGWQSFARRDHLFATQPLVLQQDAFIIACTISAQPQPPAGYWLGMNDDLPEYTLTHPSGGGLSAWAGGNGASSRCAGGTAAAGEVMSLVPEELVNALAGMINYEEYADVEFVLPAPNHAGSDDEEVDPTERPARRIYASRRILERLHYFEMMFSWEENEEDKPEVADDDQHLIDSDREEEQRGPSSPKKRRRSTEESPQAADRPIDGLPVNRSSTSLPDVNVAGHPPAPGAEGDSMHSDDEEGSKSDAESENADMSDAEARDQRQQSRPRDVTMAAADKTAKGSRKGPKRRKIVITDAALTTWYAIIYWIYTDRIVFAPLSSCFNSGHLILPDAKTKSKNGTTTPSQGSEYKTRQDWIDAWRLERDLVDMNADVIDHEEMPANGLVPVSAKAVYRLADKMEIQPLKLRAYQHIMANLTVDNVSYEVFSEFSSVFGAIRQVQMAYFLKNWGEIRKSDALKQVWTQIRLGRHVGFEEVWPLIVGQLEFKPLA